MEKISLIVVDDHPMFLAGLQQLFKKQPDFEVVGVAENPAQLRTVLQEITPALILMDIEMPQGYPRYAAEGGRWRDLPQCGTCQQVPARVPARSGSGGSPPVSADLDPARG